MVTPRGLAVIDVQGARIGPPEYDLASLVEDPYADLPVERREGLIDRYLRGSGSSAASIAIVESRRRYAACVIHRLLQALGAFAYLGGRLGKPGFLEHAPAALRTLRLRAPLAGTRLGALIVSVERVLRERA
jgi:aminoglycoside/choline kinase family phosphotransferase